MIISTDHPRWGTVRHVRTAGRGWWPAATPVRAPEFGEHRDDILADVLGLDSEQIAELAREEPLGRRNRAPPRRATVRGRG